MPEQPQLTPERYAAMEPDEVLRIMQTTAVSMIGGVLFFIGFASFLVFHKAPLAQPEKQPPAPQNGVEILVYVAIAFAVVAVVMSFVVPNLISAKGVKDIAKLVQDGTASGPKELFGRLLITARKRLIVAMALLEGKAFFNVLAFLLTSSMIPPAFVAALLAIMAIHFPTKLKLARWLEDQQRLLT
jgi:hypothetical protein